MQHVGSDVLFSSEKSINTIMTTYTCMRCRFLSQVLDPVLLHLTAQRTANRLPHTTQGIDPTTQKQAYKNSMNFHGKTPYIETNT